MRHQPRLLNTAAPPRRGVAMMLVLVCVVVGTVIAGVALTSQDNSADLGQNACNTAVSAWAAESAADLAVAALQASTDWTDADGEIISDFNFAGANVSVNVTDTEGNIPDEDDRELIMTATADVGGVSREIQKRITITPAANIDAAIDPHLGEFAVFAKSKLHILSGATVADWDKSPEANTRLPVKVGTGFSSVGDLNISGDATISRVKIFADAAASTTLDSACAAAAPMSAKIPVAIPAYPELMPSGITSLTSIATSLNYNGVAASGTFPATARYISVVVQNGATLTVDAACTPRLAASGLAVRTSGKLIIKGNVTIGVYGNTTINNLGAVILADASSSLTLYTTGNITIDNAVVGAPVAALADSSRTAKWVTNEAPLGAISVFPVSTASGGAAAPTIAISNRAIICANIHAPTATFNVVSNSWIVGRVTGNNVTIGHGSGVLYDQRYDNRVAFTNSAGPFYKGDKSPIDHLSDALASFNPATGCQYLKTYLPDTIDSLAAAPDSDSGSERTAEATTVPTLALFLERTVSGLFGGN